MGSEERDRRDEGGGLGAQGSKKNAEEIAAVRGELGDLKADLPLIYTTREDFIRVSNNIDQKLDKLLYRGAAKEG